MLPEDLRVLVLHHVARPTAAGVLESDAGVLEEVRAVVETLEAVEIPYRVAAVSDLREAAEAILAGEDSVVFNLVEDFPVGSEEAFDVPAVCRSLGRGFTGADSACLALATDKWRSRSVLAGAGVPVPRALWVARDQPLDHARLPAGPLILKPACSDASEGSHADRSIFDGADRAALAEAVAKLHEEFRQPVLIERYIDGRELNVSVLERGGRPGVLAIAEIDFSAFPPDRPRIVDYAAKWLPGSFGYNHTPRRIPAPLDDATSQRVGELALAAWSALGCRDYARVDFRLDLAGKPWVLEVNPNPDISSDAGFAAALAYAGISYRDFVRERLLLALSAVPSQAKIAPSRGQAPPRCSGARPLSPARAVPRTSGLSGAVIRRTQLSDRATILSLVERTGFFRENELLIAAEVLDEALQDGPEGHYQSFTAVLDDQPVGWVCYGPTPCTVGTFDIYWLAVDPDFQGRHIGSELLTEAEKHIARRDGRLAVAETSGRPDYEPTRRFYLARGYHEAARLADFYAPGDDKVTYMRSVEPLPTADNHISKRSGKAHIPTTHPR